MAPHMPGAVKKFQTSRLDTPGTTWSVAKMDTAPPPFHRFGMGPPRSPVVVSVPHAGRYYPQALADLVSVPMAALVPLEDRHVDAVAHAARGDETMLVASHARAWIDLNRSPDADRDPWIDEGARPAALARSDKVKSGIGLIPRRAGGADNMWRRKLTDAEVRARIVETHAPYHAALGQALAAARAAFGTAILLDLHSMPPLPGPDPAQVVLGDRFGRSCPGHVTARIAGVVRGHGCPVAIDRPYAGGHILDAHADPRGGVYALQLELDRTLYLDATLDQPGEGLARTAKTVRAVLDTLATLADPLRRAAE